MSCLLPLRLQGKRLNICKKYCYTIYLKASFELAFKYIYSCKDFNSYFFVLSAGCQWFRCSSWRVWQKKPDLKALYFL